MSLKHRLFLWTQSNLNLEIRRRLRYLRSSHQRCSMKKGVLRNFAKFTGKHLCQSNYIKKETLAQVFSCEFCGISKITFFNRTPLGDCLWILQLRTRFQTAMCCAQIYLDHKFQWPQEGLNCESLAYEVVT